MKSTFGSILVLALIASVAISSSMLTGEWNYGRAGVEILAIGCVFLGNRHARKGRPNY